LLEIFYNLKKLNIKSKENNVTVIHNVFLALTTNKSLFLCGDHVAAACHKVVISDYLCFYLFYLSLSDALSRYFTGTTIKHLTGKALAEIRILLPQIEEQQEIVKLLGKLIKKELKAKEAAEQTLIQIDTMKKTILALAFRGELGTNDPTDESAKELLKRLMTKEGVL